MTDTPKIPTIYIDIDGTLLGKNASLLHDHEGLRTTVAIDALFKAEKAGVDLVVATGRDIYRASEFCRAIGISKYIAELGCVLHTTGEDIVEYGAKAGAFVKENNLDTVKFLDCIHQAAQLLIESYPGRLEMHTPYNRDCFASFKLRGNVSVDACNNLLSSHGWPFLEFVPNGHGMFRRTMPDVENVLIYHLTPVGVTKAFGISRDQELRTLSASHCYLIGDGMADAMCSDIVDTVFIPANGPISDPNIEKYSRENDSVVILEKSHNHGFAQAIDIILRKYSL